MEAEQSKTLEALKIAIQMEIDGKEYYQKQSQNSGNSLGKKLFQSLATEEDIHRQKFEEIYHAIGSRKDWPRTDFQPDGGKTLRTIFATESEKRGSDVKASASELDAVETAMDIENKTVDFYENQSKNATYDAQMEFYRRLAAEEREHHLILLDYYEFLKDPVAWFVQEEHHSLDGG